MTPTMTPTPTMTSTSTSTSTPTSTATSAPTSERLTATLEGDYVVFLIGMRVNAWWKPWRYLPVAMAMPRMLRELGQHPELGFMGAESFFGRTTLMLSYWRSKEHLLSFATSATSTHLPAWKAFNAAGRAGDVGVWHETYLVQAGTYENVYVGMPRFGLGKVGSLVPARGRMSRASGRLGLETSPTEAAAAR